MMRKIFSSAYFWTVVGAVGIVAVAWVGRARYQPVVTGASAPEFTVRNLEGEPVSLSDYREKVVLLNIWATWCAPCREEMPSMQRLYESLAGTDFEILAVSVDAPLGEISANGMAGGDLAAFAESFGLTFPILHDPSGEIQRTYQTTGVPETFLVGKDGLIYRKVAGGTLWDAEANQELVRRLLGE
ncbi:MAG: TlpA family protein disulfide reductase [Gemmatimonadota bacterium]|nr:TlpA family protein disulfide reductase [Gemmatimonadota bacterium]